LLCHLRDDLPLFAVYTDIEQHWRRSGIPIPDVVMNELVVPDAPTGFRIETNDAVGEKVIAGPVATIIVARWCFDWEIDVAQVEIGAHRCPNCSVAGVLPRITAPCIVAEFAPLRNRMERPQQPAAANVISTHITRHVGF